MPPTVPNWRIGTMGFSYSDWAGVFYPTGMKSADYLAHYARHFNTVELDTTFYAIPPADRVRGWAAAVPEGFRFAVKTPRTVTHDGSATADTIVREMLKFLDIVRLLDEKLGVVLLQFPPSFSVRGSQRLLRLLRALPADVKCAVEFRNETWSRTATLDLLQGHRCAWVAADYGCQPRQLHRTADFLYIRWIGRHQQFPTLDHERLDVADRLAAWQRHVEPLLPHVDTVWGYMNNDYAGHAPATARKLMRRLGLPVPAASDPRQGRLFA